MRATEVFTPNSVPVHTYVDRSAYKHEDTLRDSLAVPNAVISISGPSKSGKTVLVKKAIEPDHLIEITGAAIKSAGSLWELVLAWMDAPSEKQVTIKVGGDVKLAGKASAEAGVLLAKAKAEGELAGTISGGREVKTTVASNAMMNVIRDIGGSEFTVFVDDFHYVDREIQAEVAREIKAAAERGVRICIASVPHRADDVVRGNAELRGRLRAVDLQYWTEMELRQIAEKGFRTLNVDLAPSIVSRLAKEAFGSPQLMQAMCLQLCFAKDIRATLASHQRVDIGSDDLSAIMQRTTLNTDFTSLVAGLHAGPRQRGTERKDFPLSDGSTGDVYRTILLALKQDPGQLAFRYDEILDRVKAVCLDGSPVGSSIQTSLEHMAKIAEQFPPKVLDWDDDVLDIIEPYFMFFLRFSDLLDRLAPKR